MNLDLWTMNLCAWNQWSTPEKNYVFGRLYCL